MFVMAQVLRYECRIDDAVTSAKQDPRLNILLVDDEPLLIDSLTIGLKMKDYQVVPAYSAG